MVVATTTGLYTALFIICSYLLVKSKKRQHIPFLLAVVLMFVLAAVDIVLTVQEMESSEHSEGSVVRHNYLYLANESVGRHLDPYPQH